MISKTKFEQMRKELDTFDKAREELIKTSRDVLKSSKAAIYSLHRNEEKEAKKQLNDAANSIKKIKESIKNNPDLADVGAYSEALEEYVEASCYYSFLNGKKLLYPEELNVDTETYLSGLSDLVGELVRKAINSVIKKDTKTALEIKDFATEIYEELLLFDFRNGSLRKKFDAIKYGVEKLEDLAVKIELG